MPGGSVTPWCERYEDERHRLLAGALGPETLAQLLRDERADALYSDPPWGPRACSMFHALARLPCPSAPWTELKAGLREALHHVRRGGPVWIEMGERWADELADLLSSCGHPVTQRWTTRYRSGGELLPCALLYSGTPLDFDPSDLRGADLPLACLRAYGLPSDAVVLDPCCGKGYTARACVRLGLRFRGLELNPHRLGYTEQWIGKTSRS